ncbi:hypothetical protein HPP92_027046 [Vanilla planifolia]|uniref:Uncharacterized protein n=1 Tax=Vanilla planifolia TaxID=51239 RepID=A0A835PA71_VANPL|nr:hypothetical protein HPP92_027165 [Vanilla planifolia]KAG0449903.1 hypothetical protein HPP92_027046 [Vanilla planifolia]
MNLLPHVPSYPFSVLYAVQPRPHAYLLNSIPSPSPPVRFMRRGSIPRTTTTTSVSMGSGV